MSVRYEENEHGMFWVEGDQQGEPQKDLHHAMKDYDLTRAGGNNSNAIEERVHTGDDGRPGDGPERAEEDEDEADPY